MKLWSEKDLNDKKQSCQLKSSKLLTFKKEKKPTSENFSIVSLQANTFLFLK